MIRYCQNISMDSAKRGFWLNVEQANTIYIQITDPCCGFIPNQNNFKSIHRFEFLDTEDSSDDFAITDEQAIELAAILRSANDNQNHVIVSCHAGLCRSGAVAEVMHMVFGYDASHFKRIPNVLVKNKILTALGLELNPTYSAFA